jgi:hypothetical protein
VAVGWCCWYWCDWGLNPPPRPPTCGPSRESGDQRVGPQQRGVAHMVAARERRANGSGWVGGLGWRVQPVKERN